MMALRLRLETRAANNMSILDALRRQPPIHTLPPGYAEVKHLALTQTHTLFWLNVIALLPMLLVFVLMFSWALLIEVLRGSVPTTDMPWWLLFIALVGVIFLHEWLHGLAIHRMGHKPRYGIKPKKMTVFATADNALFRRGQFIAVALAPLVIITLGGMALMFFLPDTLVFVTALCVTVNAGGATGDLWMVWETLHHSPDSLVRDEEDCIRIYEKN